MKNKNIINMIRSMSLLMLLVISLSLLTGCFKLKSDSQIADENFMKLISALQDKNQDDVRDLFAPNIVSNIENFDNSISDLIAYYDGTYKSFYSAGLGTERDKNSGIEKKWYNMSCDITTSVDTFRIATIWYVKDTGDNKNVGIWSLYIIKFGDDPNQRYSYGGDGLWTNGINIEKTHEPIDSTIND